MLLIESPSLDNRAIAIDDLPDSEVRDLCCDVGELWWNASISSRPTAAYHAGRLLGLLHWYLTQALFLASTCEETIIDDTLRRLIVVSYSLVRKPPNHLIDIITNVLDSWRDHIQSEIAADEVYACVDDNKPSWMFGTPDQRRQELVESWVDPLVTRLWDSIYEELSEAEQWAMDLGRCVDEGVRRHDLHRFLEIQRYKRWGYHDSSHNHGRYDWCEAGLQCSNFQFGELGADKPWPDKLKGLLATVGVPTASYEAILASWEHADPKDRLRNMQQIFEKLDLTVREHLRAYTGNFQGTKIPRDSNTGQSDVGDVAPGIGSKQPIAAADCSADRTSSDCYVTLRQMAAIVNRKKRTLEALAAKSGFPLPAVEGGGGKAGEWLWSEVRPVLENEYRRELPNAFPAQPHW